MAWKGRTNQTSAYAVEEEEADTYVLGDTLTAAVNLRELQRLWHRVGTVMRHVHIGLACSGGESVFYVRLTNAPPPAPHEDISPFAQCALQVGPWVSKPILVSDGETQVAAFIQGEGGSGVLTATVEGPGSMVGRAAACTLDYFEDHFNAGHSFMQLDWTSTVKKHKAKVDLTFSQLD